jgi:HlyD family secretion protein
MPKPSKRIPLWPFILLAVVALIAWAFRPVPVRVELAKAAPGPLMVTVDHDGRTRVKDRYIVSSPLAGRLQRVALKAGDSVEAGKTLLAVIEPGDPELLNPRALAQAEARVKAAEAGVRQAEAQRARMKTLLEFAMSESGRRKTTAKLGASSASDLDAAEHEEQAAQEELRSSEFAAQVAQFELEQARAALTFSKPASEGGAAVPRFEIPAPISGKVLRVFEESSTMVTPGTRMLELADTRELEIEVDILSASAVSVQPGARMIVEHWGGAKPLEARVRLVEPSAFTKVSALGIEEQRVNVIADFTSPPEERSALGDGFRIEARIVLWESGSVLKVPAGALFQEAGEWSVFVVEAGRAALRKVIVARQNDLEAQIESGLREGEEVIVYPSDRVEHGVRVAAEERR